MKSSEDAERIALELEHLLSAAGEAVSDYWNPAVDWEMVEAGRMMALRSAVRSIRLRLEHGWSCVCPICGSPESSHKRTNYKGNDLPECPPESNDAHKARR